MLFERQASGQKRAADLDVEHGGVAQIVDVNSFIVPVHARGGDRVGRGPHRPEPVGNRAKRRAQVVRIGEATAQRG